MDVFSNRGICALLKHCLAEVGCRIKCANVSYALVCLI